MDKLYQLDIILARSLATRLSNLLIILLLSLLFIKESKAEDNTLETVLDVMENISCFSQGIGDIIRQENSHTCIPAPLFNTAIANLISPLLYANFMFKLKLHDEELLPKSCSRKNRIDYYDQKLSFYMCNDTLIAAERTVAAIEAIIPVVEGFITGQSPWKDIADAWNVPAIDYHTPFLNKRDQEEGILVDPLSVPLLFPWKVIRKNDTMCVQTISLVGWLSVGCKYLTDPHENSLYGEFWGKKPLDISNNSSSQSNSVTNTINVTKCAGTRSCYINAKENSMSPTIISGPLIECVKAMVSKMMVNEPACDFKDVPDYIKDEKSSTGLNYGRSSTALFAFQQNMQLTVTALLILYVIFFGFNMILSGEGLSKAEMVNFIIKFVFVVYFSIGINVNGSNAEKLDGMVEWGFPFLLNGMTQVVSWVANASPSGLCKFNAEDYAEGFAHLAPWDALDCRISHYLGLDILQSMIIDNAVTMRSLDKDNWQNFDIISFPIPPYIYLIIIAVVTGVPDLITLAVMYPLLVISVAAFVINATVVCIIAITILSILAPLFVPMILFQHTRGYFDSWVKLLISFMLQPMVAMIFMLTMMSIYDYGFYGTCKYTPTYYAFNSDGTRLEMQNNPNMQGNGRVVKHFSLNTNWDDYLVNSEVDEVEDCRTSLGFILNNPFSLLGTVGGSVAAKTQTPNDFPSGAKFVPGLFFTTIDVVMDTLKRIMMSFFVACCVLYLIYQASERLAEFAADMTEGISIGNMAIKPQAIFKAGMKAIGAVTGAMGAASGGGGGGDMGGGDMSGVTGGGSPSGDGGGGTSGGSGGKMKERFGNTPQVDSDKSSLKGKDGPPPPYLGPTKDSQKPEPLSVEALLAEAKTPQAAQLQKRIETFDPKGEVPEIESPKIESPKIESKYTRRVQAKLGVRYNPDGSRGSPEDTGGSTKNE